MIYICTSRDMIISLGHYKSMVERMRAERRAVRTFELDNGHCPNLTMTREVVDIVTRGAAVQR